jgi:hypothetical protein
LAIHASSRQQSAMPDDQSILACSIAASRSARPVFLAMPRGVRPSWSAIEGVAAGG